jgi:hypothetical protein
MSCRAPMPSAPRNPFEIWAGLKDGGYRCRLGARQLWPADG